MSGIKQLLRPSICSKIDGLLSGLVTAIIEPPSCGKFEMWQAEQNLTLLDTNILSSTKLCDLCFFRSTTTTLHIRSCSLVFFQFAELSNTKYPDAMYLAWSMGVGKTYCASTSRPVGRDKYLVFNQHQLSSHRAHAH